MFIIVATNKKKRGISMSNYTYSKVTAQNGVVLHSMKGSPVDIRLHSRGKLESPKSILDSGWLYGINGGFFNVSNKQLLSISLKNGSEITAGGSSNARANRGTLIWDNKAKKFYCKQITTKTQVEALVSDKTNYWAQGGVSLALRQSDSDWKDMIAPNNEYLPGSTSNTQRAAVVYNNTNNIWLIVTDTKCTITEFRTAINENIGSGTLVDGISLDGSTCAQMYCAEKHVQHPRSVVSVIGFKRP